MMEKLPNVTGLLLAGGKSRRMGRDKRNIKFLGISLLERVLGVLEKLFPEVLIVVADVDDDLMKYGSRVVQDLIPNRATAGGLYTGLTHSASSKVFAVACDMPFLNPGVISYMHSLSFPYDVVMAELPNGLQPMHAFYSKQCLPVLEEMVTTEQLRIQELVHQKNLKVHIVKEAAIRSVDAQCLSFLNINTPADLEFAQKLVSS